MDHRSVEDRLQHLEDEREITRVLYRYAHGLDYGPEDEFLDVFTPGGVWRRVEARLPARSFTGHGGLSQMYRDHTHAPDYFHKHLVVNPHVSLDSDTAEARSYLVLVSEHPTGPYVRAFSRCTDQLIRSTDARWRIAERRAELEAWSDHDFPPAPWANTPLVAQ